MQTLGFLIIDDIICIKAAEIDLDYTLKYLEIGARRRGVFSQSEEWCEGLQGAFLN